MFSTYAVPMIAGEIKRFLRDDGPIKVSRSLKELNGKARAAQAALSLKLKRVRNHFTEKTMRKMRTFWISW